MRKLPKPRERPLSTRREIPDMATTLHVFDYLKSPGKHEPKPVCVVFGDESFLKGLALAELRRSIFGDDEPPFSTFDGASVEWRDVIDELTTVSLFGGSGKRLALVENADDFVRVYRARLEDYAERPKSGGTLVLVVSVWQANTRLYRILDKGGLQIECRAPLKSRGRRKELDEAATLKWLAARSRSAHGPRLTSDAARMLLDFSGPNFGLLDQELSKLALYVDRGEEVTAELVRDIVGGWKTKSVWDLMDLACDGNTADALRELDHLLHAGENPLALFGQISWWLRRYAVATRIYQRAERQGRRMPLRRALEQAGFRDWPRGTLARSEAQLKQLGRDRGEQILRWLLEADLSMKLSHSSPHRARFVLERLLLRLTKGLSKKHAARSPQPT
jgi:DNA polymerase-3 subunit delta